MMTACTDIVVQTCMCMCILVYYTHMHSRLLFQVRQPKSWPSTGKARMPSDSPYHCLSMRLEHACILARTRQLCVVRPWAGIILHARSHSALSWEEESTQASLSIHDICTVCPSQFIQILLHLRPLHLFIFTTRHTAHGESGPFNLPCSPPIFLRRQNRNLVRCLP